MKKLITAAACIFMASCASAQQVSSKDMDDCYAMANAFKVVASAYSRGVTRVELVKAAEGNKHYIQIILVTANAVDKGLTAEQIADHAFTGCVEDAMKKTTDI